MGSLGHVKRCFYSRGMLDSCLIALNHRMTELEGALRLAVPWGTRHVPGSMHRAEEWTRTQYLSCIPRAEAFEGVDVFHPSPIHPSICQNDCVRFYEFVPFGLAFSLPFRCPCSASASVSLCVLPLSVRVCVLLNPALNLSCIQLNIYMLHPLNIPLNNSPAFYPLPVV